MLDKIFGSLFKNGSTPSVGNFFICMAAALCCGLVLAVMYSVKSRCTKSFAVTLALLPAVVGMVIMLVNGNIGAGVAVAGAFSLVRFRSSPGTAKEISAIFIAMCVGLAVGMGYVAYAVIFAVLMSVILLVLNLSGIWERSRVGKEKTLRITIPEDLNYSEVFEEIFKQYTDRCNAVSVRTTNMGSMFKLTYHVRLKDPMQEKAFIDALRCRNGNLEIMLSDKEDLPNAL